MWTIDDMYLLGLRDFLFEIAVEAMRFREAELTGVSIWKILISGVFRVSWFGFMPFRSSLFRFCSSGERLKLLLMFI